MKSKGQIAIVTMVAMIGLVLAVGFAIATRVGIIAGGDRFESPRTTGTLAFASVEYAQDEADLVRKSSLIIIGEPVGTVDEVVLTSDGYVSDYYQSVKVERVLRGDNPGSTIQVVRVGPGSKALKTGVRHDGEGTLGPLKPGRKLMFLMPSAKPGVFQVVGHASGEIGLDASSRVLATRREVQALNNLTIDGVSQLITSLSSGSK